MIQKTEQGIDILLFCLKPISFRSANSIKLFSLESAAGFRSVKPKGIQCGQRVQKAFLW